MKLNPAERLVELGQENAKLKPLVVERSLQYQILNANSFSQPEAVPQSPSLAVAQEFPPVTMAQSIAEASGEEVLR